GNEELEYYTDTRNNTYVQNGSLVIEARKETTPASSCPVVGGGTGACLYTSARITTLGKHEQMYGRFESRIKIPAGSGSRPALWMMGNDYGNDNWPGCGEIDIMENWGTDGTVDTVTTHDPGGDAKYQDDGISKEYDTGAALANDYHVYAMEWDADTIRFLF